jgi:hypothetical protein
MCYQSSPPLTPRRRGEKDFVHKKYSQLGEGGTPKAWGMRDLDKTNRHPSLHLFIISDTY